MRMDHGGLRAGAPWAVETELGEADEEKVAKEQGFFSP